MQKFHLLTSLMQIMVMGMGYRERNFHPLISLGLTMLVAYSGNQLANVNRRGAFPAEA